MGDSETGQVSAEAARIYEEIYLPALFQQWCSLAISAAGIAAGDNVADIACGTGALAIAVSQRVAPGGKTVGIDNNQGMLDVARAKSSMVEWRHSQAERLPYADDHFDCVVSQFGLMYFEDRERAVREMLRVLRPGGKLAVIVWDTLDNNPGLAAEEYLWQQVFGEEVDAAPYCLGEPTVIQTLFAASGVNEVQIATHQGTASFGSIRQWIETGARGWTDDDSLSEDELALLLDTAEKELIRFRTSDGKARFPTSAHVITARK